MNGGWGGRPRDPDPGDVQPEGGVATLERELEPDVQWRLDSLVQAGWDVERAMIAAERRDVCLHTLLDFTAKGCPAELSLRILL